MNKAAKVVQLPITQTGILEISPPKLGLAPVSARNYPLEGPVVPGLIMVLLAASTVVVLMGFGIAWVISHA